MYTDKTEQQEQHKALSDSVNTICEDEGIGFTNYTEFDFNSGWDYISLANKAMCCLWGFK